MARPKRVAPREALNIVGQRVREARSQQTPPLAQEDLAVALGEQLGQPVGRTTITRLERGQRPVTDIEVVALAKALGVDVRWLLGQ